MIHEFLIPIAKAASEAAATEGSGGVLGTLGINWKLFLAQFVNFGIILLVLWKWVFTPVTKGLEARTKKIENSLNDAERIQKEKEDFSHWRDLEMTKIRSQSSAIITAAEVQAQKAKEQIAQETKLEQEKIVNQAKQQIEGEKQRAIAEVKTEAANLITTATEKIIKHKLDDKKDQELIKESLKSL